MRERNPTSTVCSFTRKVKNFYPPLGVAGFRTKTWISTLLKDYVPPASGYWFKTAWNLSTDCHKTFAFL